MPRTAERGGPQTRARIAEAAARLFLDRGFDGVTVAEIARAAGVSSVTVFNHFPRKEDLFLDRSEDAVELIESAVRRVPAGGDVPASLRDALLALLEERHPLSGTDPGSLPFFRTVAGSSALTARARGIAAELQAVLERELRASPAFDGDPVLLAALLVAGCSAVLTGTARLRLEGADAEDVVDDHRERLVRLFRLLQDGAGPRG